MSIVNKKRVCIIVLGDIGRSPRMQYHAKSFLDCNYHVDFIGYIETKPLTEISEKTNIKKLNVFPELNLPSPVKYLFKTLWQTLSLLIALLSINRPQIILCQNPPAIPTLFVCYFYCLVMRCKFIIDWHNYAYTIMALSLSSQSRIVKIAKAIEIFFGRRSYANLCVTKAMKIDLESKYGIRATVLYDRPPEHFQSISLKRKHDLYRKLGDNYIEFHQKNSDLNEQSEIIENTIFTEKTNHDVKLISKRPGLLVSSTSWTPDEDFAILLEALEEYEKVSQKSQHFPNLICVITGKGPLKSHYIDLIFKKKWKNIQVITPWLEVEDYPLLLASADLGVCLHYSSSGLDLPMKVVDMFGCGLPVCAINFKCLSELVENEKNGFIFENSKELSSHIQNWFYDFPNNVALCNVKEKIQDNLKKFQTIRWHENWTLNALPLFE